MKANNTRKITYSAVGAAVAAVCVFLTNFGWLKVSLLMAAALCYYIVLVKCGFWYGVAGIIVSLVLAVLVGGAFGYSAFFLDALVFAPFALLSYGIRKIYYTKWQTFLLRLGIMAAFANVALCVVWFTSKWITTVDIVAVAAKLGGYPLLAVLFTVFVLIFDILFNQLSIRLMRLIK